LPARLDAKYRVPDAETTGEYSSEPELIERYSIRPSSTKLYRQMLVSVSSSSALLGRSDTKYSHRPSGETNGSLSEYFPEKPIKAGVAHSPSRSREV
jgi:hypothetical protein